MARTAKVEDAEIIRYLNEYYNEHPGIKIKYTDLENYIISKGINLTPGSIRKKKKIVECIKNINDHSEENIINTISAYSPLDTAELNRKYRLSPALLEILNKREIWVKQMSESADYVLKENRNLREQNSKIISENIFLRKENEEYKEEIAKVKELKKQIAYLKNMLENTAYEEVYQLISDGLNRLDYISKDKVDEATLTLNKNIDEVAKLNNKAAKDFLDGFGDDDE